VRQAERVEGQLPGLTTDERQRLKRLERENFELKRANEILRKASEFFAHSRPSSSPYLNGWIGSIIAGCSNRSATCRRPSTKRATMSKGRRTDSHNPSPTIPVRFSVCPCCCRSCRH
jgi:hypothetical protein